MSWFNKLIIVLLGFFVWSTFLVATDWRHNELPDEIIDDIPLKRPRRPHELPDEIIHDLPLLMVDRKSSTTDSFMITEDIVGAARPKKVYRVTPTGLEESKETLQVHKQEAPIFLPSVPSYVSIPGDWENGGASEERSANILGGFGKLKIKNKTLAIPVAETKMDALAYYGARLLSFGDEIIFDTDRALPICNMRIGENYVRDYLLQKNLGGGFYLEYHDLPHFHMSLDANARGYLILGKKAEDGNFHLSAFSIPYGKAIYTPGNIIHDDALLIGHYQVIYSVTENFSTVSVTSLSGQLVDVMPVE